jgi:septal ring factor EnvC (AmiA/AmiB activator)
VKTTQATASSNKSNLARQESSLESANDKLNRINSQLAKLDQRIKGTEEWVESINGFRRQVLRDIDSLNKSTAQLQASP